ncbi:hypothetical protein E2C01_007122 [Portunus trituberculatus]|uniref:Uncharacterized protein n=1 Tax=Portunus trituberculatus TaxID=210409 RepID=A0A5B7CYK8_PORTR|nr:hypothetical protein [Portunus trituberculatus]
MKCDCRYRVTTTTIAITTTIKALHIAHQGLESSAGGEWGVTVLRGTHVVGHVTGSRQPFPSVPPPLCFRPVCGSSSSQRREGTAAPWPRVFATLSSAVLVFSDYSYITILDLL